MTAAALKPDLFNHLIATHPDRSGDGSLKATLFSVALHASIVAAVLWAGYQVSDDPVAPPREDPPHIFIPSVAQAIESPAAAPPSQGGVVLPSTPLPIPGPPAAGIPDVRDTRVDFGDPGVPAAGVGGNPAVAGPGGGGGAGTAGVFTVVEVMPALLNAADVKRALERKYPPLLRDAGIGGRTHLLLLIDEQGRVLEAKIKESSGQPALDRVAMDVAPLMRFSPAMNHDQRVKVWAQVPLDFRTD